MAAIQAYVEGLINKSAAKKQQAEKTGYSPETVQAIQPDMLPVPENGTLRQGLSWKVRSTPHLH